MHLLIHQMTFRCSTSSFIDVPTFKCLTFSFADALAFKRTTFSYVHVPTTFKCLPSNASSFKHWTSPFEKTLMTLKQTNKIRHRNGYLLLPLQTLKPILSSHCQTSHMLKITQGKTWKCTKIDAFPSFTPCFSLRQLLTVCFLLCPVFSTNTRYSP
jgi:hypothetical protein